MKISSIVLFVVSYSSFVYTQCSENKIINYTDGSVGNYLGCLDDYENFHGNGTLTNDTYIKSGIWDQGKLNGEGTFTLISDNSFFKGEWKNDELIYGTYSKKANNFSLSYLGEFKNLKFHGQGKRTLTTSTYTEIKEGSFINDTILNGTETTTYETGLVVISTYKMGEVVSRLRNDRNYYNKNHIIGDSESTEVALNTEGDENDGKTYFIDLNIGDFKGSWVFDSGAQLTSIGKRMFERLQSEGVQFKDLDLTIKTFGVGGVSNGSLVMIENFKVGNYVIKEFIIKVSLDNNYSLLGVDFMDKFENVIWNKKNSTLTFYK